MQVTAKLLSFRSVLPRGQTLPDDVFQLRHLWIQRLLWFHVVALPIFGVVQGYSVQHSILESSPLLAIAIAARFANTRRLCASLMAMGLLTSSAILVHLWHGAIEAHFHFFVMIPVLALYEDWIPFLLAVAYVAVHHGVAGAIDPQTVYNHPDAQAHPWKWAGIHGFFVACAGAVAIASWRFNEDVRAQTRAEAGRRADAEAVAVALGRGLRPDTLPALEQGNVAARYLPAGTREIGGDWYDVIDLPDGRVVLTLGDVAGHGVQAASSMAGLRHSVRAYAHEGLAPAQVAARIDRYFQGEFATFVYLVYDAEAGDLRFANAGHLPPLLTAPSGEPRFLSEWLSTPLGLGEDTGFQEGVLEFPLGSTVLIYTDGLIERRDARIDHQLERLRRAVGEGARDSEGVCASALAAFAPEGSDDDVALLAFQAAPTPRETFTVRPHPDALGEARQRMRAWLLVVGADAIAIDELVLAADEAITNALEHSGSARGARVELSQVGADVHIKVRDFGSWSRRPGDPDRGRGLTLVEALTDRYDVSLSETGTTVTMVRGIREPAALGAGEVVEAEA
jgi:anti-sigma regulatory factor (Ser/Thr protein kinase)